MSIDAMKQALEALIASEHLLEIKVNKAIERDAADAWVLEKEADLRQHKKAITSLRQAIEQAEKQEPFGYLWPTERHPEFRFTQQLRDGVEGTPVYTTPQPHREWVGLTDEEIQQVFIANSVMVDNGNTYMVAGLRAVNIGTAIEAKLKELNHVN